MLSFNENGALQLGAGTSLYNRLLSNTIGTNQCAGFPSLTAIGDKYYLLSYANKNDYNSTLQLIYVSSPTQAQILTTITSTDYIYKVITLDATAGTILAISQDFSQSQDAAYLLPGVVDVSAKTITLSTDKAKTYSSSVYSVDPDLVRLSDNSFALSYYTTSPSMATTRAGTVDISLTITLSPESNFADNSNNATYSTITPLTASSYMLAFYDASESEVPDELAGALQVTLAHVPADITLGVHLSNRTVNKNSWLSYSLTATTLSNDTALIVYANAQDNYNLVAQVVKVLDDNIYVNTTGNASVTFGGQWTVNTGRVFYSTTGGSPDIDVVTVDTDGHFLVLYTDLSNDMALTATMGEVTSSGEIDRASPDFILSDRLQTTFSTSYTSGALSTGRAISQDSQTAVFYMISDANVCTNAPVTAFNLLHRLGGPAGITTKSSTGAVTVAVSGPLSNTYSTLTAGHVYYSNTLGDVVDSYQYVGREESSKGYVVDTANDAFVTSDSKVGFALQSNQLLVQLP